MKPLFLLASLFIFFQQDSFHDKVLQDFDRYSFFVACTIKSHAYTGKIIIENSNLYFYYHRKQGFTQEAYVAFMKKNLEKKDTIDIDSKNLDELGDWGFRRADRFDSVYKYSSQGVDSFLKHYFNGIVIKEGLPYRERTAAVYQLFEWNIACSPDDETGLTMLRRK